VRLHLGIMIVTWRRTGWKSRAARVRVGRQSMQEMDELENEEIHMFILFR
jgi:hypothetical protein